MSAQTAGLAESVEESLSTAWILDCDTTVKPLYGRQAGAEVSYNPQKPGRPSHVVHTYWISPLRLVLDADVQGGKSQTAKHGLPRFCAVLSGLTPPQRPALVRGDSAFGNEGVMAAMETLKQAYLFKLRQTSGIKRLIERQWSRRDWQAVGQGFDAVETTLQLSGWSRARRVVVLRRRVRDRLVAEVQGNPPSGQQTLLFADAKEDTRLWEYAVLVSNTDHSLDAIGQLYRDRADSENGFDELKKQWGWGGYTTHDLERCNLSARAVALVYNGWTWYVRLAHPQARREAITSRPLLLSGVARMPPACRSEALADHPDACRRRPNSGHAGRDPHGFGSRSDNCATVTRPRTLARAGALHHRSNTRRQGRSGTTALVPRYT